MAKLELLNVFVNDRLTAAAQDIFRAVRDLVLDYQSEVLRSNEENERLRRLLNAAVQRLLLQPELQSVQPPEVDSLGESEQRRCEEKLPRVKEEPKGADVHGCSQEEPREGNCTRGESQTPRPAANHVASPSTTSEVKTESEGELVSARQPDDSSSSTACHPNCGAAPFAAPAANTHAKGLPHSSGKALTNVLQVKNGKSFRAPPAPLHSSYPGQRIQRWHPCKECGKAFSFACQLEVHMRWHTKEKPYSCSVCRKSFTTVSMLKRHHRIHTGEKPFRCHVCGKCFNQSAHLNTHFRLHTRERHCKAPKS